MKYFCTLSDKNYIIQGLALLNSLQKTCKDSFILYYLCLDDETYNILSTTMNTYKDVNNIKLIPIHELEKNKLSNELLTYKSKIEYKEYCFTLSAFFTWYLLKSHCKNCDIITYLDADIYFYKDIDLIYNEIGTKSVGIIPHRHQTLPSIYGFYNVSLVYFKNNETGLKVLEWWKDCMLKRTNPELHTCFDQKYLDEFIPLFGENNICVVNKNANGAPWNYRLYVWDQFELTGKVQYGNELQFLIFNHFSKIICDFNNNKFSFDNGVYNKETYDQIIYKYNPTLYKIYSDYFNVLSKIKRNIV